MSKSDGSVIGTTQILNNGSPIYRFNIVLLSDGYQSSQLGQYAADAQSFVNRLSRTPPFHLMMNSINVFRVDVSSIDSGVDDPTECGGTGATARTYFDATLCSYGKIQRLCGVNTATALEVASAQVPHYNLAVVLVNSPIFGGSGGDIAVYTQHAAALDIAVHEMGHAAFGLADEYDNYRGCDSGETDRNNHPPIEPMAENVTIFSDRNRLKWARYVLPGTNLPTTQNPDCAVCDTQKSRMAEGTVGAFEGADYFHCGAFRPEFQCMMRTARDEFCRVCRDVIRRKMSYYSPLTFRFAWKGVGGGQNIYVGRGNDQDQNKLNDFGTSHAPAVGRFTVPFMAWKGTFGDQGIYYSRQSHIDGVTWEPQRNVPGVGTSTGPTLAVFDNKLYMAWKGAFGDQGIYYSSLDVSAVSWVQQRNVPNVGTSTRPALAAFQGRLYMVWKGIEGDQSMWFSSFDGNSWKPQAPIPNVGTSTYPSLAVLRDKLYMVWKGIEGDQSMWFTSFDGNSWNPQAPIPNVGTSAGASLAAGPDRLFMVWSGIGGDPSIYFTAFDGDYWGPQENYLGTGSSSVPSLLVTF
jgi:hypothetical protein